MDQSYENGQTIAKKHLRPWNMPAVVNGDILLNENVVTLTAVQPDNNIEKRAISTFAEILKLARVSILDHYTIPPRAISFVHGEQSVTFGTLGNFSLVTGKAKSKKTFLMIMVLAACLGCVPLMGTIQSDLPTDKKRIILIDTEQSKYHVWKRLKAIAALAGIDDLTQIEVYSFREFSTAERRKLIEYLLTEGNPLGDIGLFVIDGVRDLVNDINDPKEATEIASFLMRLTTIAWCHIITVLHQNKGDQNARGHVGTELQNKAEATISVTVQKEDKNVSVVQSEDLRDNKDFPPFAFKINDLGWPEILSEYESDSAVEKKQKGFNAYDIPPEIHHQVLSKIFKTQAEFSRGEFLSELITAWKALGQNLAENPAKELTSYYNQMGWAKNLGGTGKVARWVYLKNPV
jgi:hypothetical protein